MDDSALRRRQAVLVARRAVVGLVLLAAAAAAVHLVASARATARGAWVDGSAAVLDGLAVSPRDPRVRVAVWRSCADPTAAGCRSLVAVTRDGFATRRLVPLEHSDFRAGAGPAAGAPRVTATRAGSFLVETADQPPFLLHGDGRRTALGRPAASAPARPGELVTWLAGQAAAVDPRTGATHWLPGGPDAGSPVQQADGRLLRVHIEHPDRPAFSYQWSDDGGRTWSGHRAPTSATVGFLPVPSGRRGTVAFLQGRAGPGAMPFLAAERGAADGSWWRRTVQPVPALRVDAGVVLPDGRLVVDVVGGGGRPPGPYVSAGADWSRFARLRPPGPALPGLRLVGSDVRDGHATLLVAAGGRAWSVEGGAWERVRAR